jgi:enoyl-CoA hydratase/carnithine racemase
MSETAYIEEKFAAVGLMPDGAGTFHLPRLVGSARALEHMLLGTRFTAELALELGIANRVVPGAKLMEEAGALAQRLAAGPPLAFAAIKRAVREGLGSNLESALAREREGQLALLASADVREGISAFFEKRRANFRGV